MAKKEEFKAGDTIYYVDGDRIIKGQIVWYGGCFPVELQDEEGKFLIKKLDNPDEWDDLKRRTAEEISHRKNDKKMLKLQKNFINVSIRWTNYKIKKESKALDRLYDQYERIQQKLANKSGKSPKTKARTTLVR